MRNIEVTAKTVEQAIDKGLQMLGIGREEVEVKILSEGSMLKRAVVEIYTFASEEERQEYLAANKKKPEVKLVRTKEEPVIEDNSAIAGAQEVSELVMDFLTTLLKEMNIEGSVSRVIRNGDMTFRITGNSINNLIGYHGETLEAVQYIVNTITKSKVPQYFKKVYIDVEDYRKKRQESVEMLAEKMAKKVISLKKTIKLEPMNSFERKAIHSVLTNIEHIRTHSEGVEPNRYLVISYVE